MIAPGYLVPDGSKDAFPEEHRMVACFRLPAVRFARRSVAG
jgi:hypothetical protein